MVEGGPATARTFLSRSLVDRAIIISAPITFDLQPVPSHLSEMALVEAGLNKVGEHTLWGGDRTSLWVREGVEWPGGDLNAWP